ncbi:IS5/IS1182 family transposase, partial [Galbibacter sp. EGI 63066]|nr:IS5/IS1182 family transposase [Galbibacter sp. EGI 63066]
QGIPLAMSNPVAGNHNDLHNIEVEFEVVTGTLGDANIAVGGLFLNADAGFDSEGFGQACQLKEIQCQYLFQ